MAEHIRIGDVAPRVHYAADGAQTVFIFPFPIFKPADIEIRIDGLLFAGGFAVQGAGASEGGSVIFAQPPQAGALVALRRRMVIARTTDFQPNGMLRANTLNDDLDRQVAAMQEFRDETGSMLRANPGEAPTGLMLPDRPARANRVLGFDSLGNVTAFAREEGTLRVPFTGAIPRTIADKMGEVLSARDFGAVGDGVTDDGPALQAAMNAAAAAAKHLVIGEGSYRTAMPLLLPGAASGLTMRGVIVYAGPDGRTALTLGDGYAVRNANKLYDGLRVKRAMLSSWLNEADIGIELRNLDASTVEIRQAEGFTIGIRTTGVERGFEDSTLHLGRIVDNRFGLDVRTATAAAWNNSIRYIGGHFACSSATHPTMDRFGVRFSAAPGAYPRHNAHLFMGPGFELQRQGTPATVAAIPFLLEAGDERGIVARGMRMEQCSTFVAAHNGGANDCVYEVAYTGTYAFTGNAILYGPNATRAGGTVVPLHQAAAAHGTPRLVAAAENVRARAFRQTIDTAGGVGFEQMAVLSGNPAGPPGNLSGFAFAGLTQFGLNADSVGLPTSRALSFVVDCGECKEFFIAAEGSELRPVVMQFDANEAVLDSMSPVLLSNMNTVWAGTPSFFWEGNADLDSLVGGLAINKLQRVTLHANARFAAIGVRGGSATAVLKALRLFCPPLYAPTLLYGGSRKWGVREYTTSDAGWVVPALAAGASTSRDVAMPGIRQGDFVQASFAKTAGFQNGGVVFHAAVGGSAGSDQVRVTAQNHSGGSITVDAGTLFVRATKPRI
ncbi:glycosyl hydrolase family 28-related protein [Roseomonas haemaphysalidis]|uniref:Hydrolase n=1 Tax=Roseomonas haemaphysalidis TaxID=2768162 RepID=A0ABS3KJA2_9PROT|nr:glycosyl hydrolase family 28-related protein [Roseomonas haemaphysalidis]MBO1077534.1 hydrolase [Roseomonas haemaphysalidis]